MNDRCPICGGWKAHSSMILHPHKDYPFIVWTPRDDINTFSAIGYRTLEGAWELVKGRPGSFLTVTLEADRLYGG